MRDSFIFYRSFFEAISELPDEQKGRIFSAICDYTLNENPHELTGVDKCVFTLIKPQLDANNKKYKNGLKGASHGAKGGRPKKQKTPKKPLNNPNLTPNDNENDNEVVVDTAREVANNIRLGEEISKITGWDKDPNWFGDYSRIEVWLGQGWDEEKDILPTVKTLMINKTGLPPRTLKYFEQAIADAHVYRTSPTPKGKMYNGKESSKDKLARETHELLEQIRDSDRPEDPVNYN